MKKYSNNYKYWQKLFDLSQLRHLVSSSWGSEQIFQSFSFVRGIMGRLGIEQWKCVL